MKIYNILLMISLIFIFISCQSSQSQKQGISKESDIKNKKEKIEKTKNIEKKENIETSSKIVSEKIDPNFKKKIMDLIKERKFFEAYLTLDHYKNKNDWVIAYLIFTGYALRKLEENPIQDILISPEETRKEIKKLIKEERYYEALEKAFKLEPKTEEDILTIMAIGYKLFKKSGSKRLTQYLSIVMVGYLYGRLKKNKNIQDKAEEYINKISPSQVDIKDKNKYKEALIKAAKFFKSLEQDFEELIVRHLQKIGYTLLEIHSKDFNIIEALEKKVKEGDKYSAFYLEWYKGYLEFEKILSKLLKTL